MSAQQQPPESWYRVRWAVDVTAWRPTARELTSALAALPRHEQASCARFLHEQDRKRALVSRLLQRRFGCRALGVATLDAVPIVRTDRGKPYFRPLPFLARAPNLNFNVSHEGDWVVLASEPRLACGVDVAAPGQLCFLPELPVLERMRSLHDCFSPAERAPRGGPDRVAASIGQSACDFGSAVQMAAAEAAQKALARPHGNCDVCGAPSADAVAEHFFRHLWSAKESVLKARGDGLTLPPSRVSFELPRTLPMWCEHTDARWAAGADVVRAALHLNGTSAPQWRVRLSTLPRNHIVAVATAPPPEMVDEDILATMHEPGATLASHVTERCLPFDITSAEQLLRA